jgi:hypothetical protein
MTFRQAEPAGLTDPTNTIELWEGERRVATLYAMSAGIHLECAPGYEPDAHCMVIEVQRPFGVIVGLRRAV